MQPFYTKKCTRYLNLKIYQDDMIRQDYEDESNVKRKEKIQNKPFTTSPGSGTEANVRIKTFQHKS